MSEAASNDLPEPASIPVAGPVAKTTLGAQLAAEREAREWTIEHVASQLNLAPRQIQALESDNYSALPGMASVRGFVRAYAKLLKIDADPLVSMIASEQITPTQPLEPKRSVSSAPFSDNRLMSSGRRRSSPKTILIALVLGLLAVAAIDVERMGGWPVLSQSLSTHIKDVAASSASSSATDDASAASAPNSVSESLPVQQTESASTSAAAASNSNTMEPANDTTKVETPKAELPKGDVVVPQPVVEKPVADKPAVAQPIKPASVAPAVASVVEKPVASPSPAGTKNLLVFTARKDSWIEVKDAHSVIFSRVIKAGSTEQLEVTQAISVIVGNAAGVDVAFRGAPVETKTDAKSNVARLSLK